MAFEDCSFIANDQCIKDTLDEIVMMVKSGDLPLSRGEYSPGHTIDFDPYFISPQYLSSLLSSGEVLNTNNACNLFNFDLESTPFVNTLRERLMYFFNKHMIENSGHFVYPAEDGFMGWHTNIRSTGKRLYCVYVDESNKSYFAYWDGTQIIKDWDQQGWNFRLFDINKTTPFWHCVYSRTTRYSIGFRIKRVMK